jgi:hypothetical protein
MSTEQQKHDNPPIEPPGGGHTITVIVDTKPKEVKPGSRLVSEFKKEVGVEASLALDEVINGEFQTLDDSGHVHPKGGEVFVSHVRTGGSS